MSRHRPVPLHVPPPSSKIAFVQLCGRGGVTPLSSLPPLPCAPEGAQVGFELLTATEAIGSLKLKRLTGGLRRCRQIAQSLSPSAAAPLAPLAGSRRPRRCLDEPPSPLVLSHFQLACRSQRHPCRRHRCLLGSPTR